MNQDALKLIFGIFGTVAAVFAWAGVFYPQFRMRWKGGNRAPLPRQSSIVAALAITSWCLAVFGLYPLFGVAVFGICVAVGLIGANRDREAYDTARGVTRRPAAPLKPDQLWFLLCVVDALFLVASLVAVVRDLWRPPITDKQHFVHYTGAGYLVASGIGAVALYFKRPKRNT